MSEEIILNIEENTTVIVKKTNTFFQLIFGVYTVIFCFISKNGETFHVKYEDETIDENTPDFEKEILNTEECKIEKDGNKYLLTFEDNYIIEFYNSDYCLHHTFIVMKDKEVILFDYL
jgi:hypothetical protein